MLAEMKGCFILQRRFAYRIGHQLAILLKEKHVVDEFCAYVHLRSSYDFLAGQKDIPYTNLILDEEIQKRYKHEVLDLAYLRHIEKEYGNVWRFINVDRVIRFGQLVREYPYDTSPYTHEELLRIVQVYAKAIIAFLDEEKPDFIFSYQPGALGSLLFHAIARKRSIPILSVIFPLTRNRIAVSERYERWSGLEEIYEKNLGIPLKNIPQYEQATSFISEFRNKPSVYSNVYISLVKYGTWRQFDFLLPQKFLRTLYYNMYRIFADWIGDAKRRTDYTTIHPGWHLFDRVKRKLRNLRGVDDLYDEFDPEREFTFYPLHYEPELALLLWAPFDTDQLAIVKRVAQSLPVGMDLYVKEHPQMTVYRPRSFYKELKKIPNVKLLRTEIPSFDIIRKCRLVTILSGAIGWEASLLGKPVITFGEVFYNAFPPILHSDTPCELPALVQKQLSAPPQDDEILTRFVAALMEDSAECDLLYLWEIEKDATKVRAALVDFSDLIARKIRLVTR